MIDKIRKEIGLIDWRDKEAVIEFYESNKLYFKNVKVSSEFNEILEDVDVIISYCFALIDKSYYTKGLEVIPTLNILLNHVENKKSKEYMLRYERYLFAEALIYARLNRIDESQPLFRELVKIDPNNDNYRGWFQNNRIRLLQKQSNIIGFFGFGIGMLDFFMNIVFNKDIGKYTSIIGFTIILYTVSKTLQHQWQLTPSITTGTTALDLSILVQILLASETK